MYLNQNSDFIFLFQATMTNCNGDPDQENKPRMDYETSTLLVSDARRKRDARDLLKNKGYAIFVDTLTDKKVPMDVMFKHVFDTWLSDTSKMKELFNENKQLADKWQALMGNRDDFKKAYEEKKNNLSKDEKKDFGDFNNMLMTEIIKRSLIDIRLFGSAMAVEGITRTYTGPVQINWGYSLHPVELVKSNTITSIMNDDNSTFGKKYKVYYALVAHYGTINKYSAQLTGMTENDRDILRKALVQGLASNQTDSKQGQDPLMYLEIIYKPEFDGYLGDLRRFIEVTYQIDQPIRRLEDIQVDFSKLSQAIEQLKKDGYIEKVVGWLHPVVDKKHLMNLPEYQEIDLWQPIQARE